MQKGERKEKRRREWLECTRQKHENKTCLPCFVADAEIIIFLTSNFVPQVGPMDHLQIDHLDPSNLSQTYRYIIYILVACRLDMLCGIRALQIQQLKKPE